MKTIISVLLLLGVFNVNAQKNIFLGGEFWNESTTIEQVEAAIKKGNDPTEFNAFNFDATAYAILNKVPFETMKYLLSIKGNEVSKITHDGRNYLMWAGYKGNFELVEFLINEGADLKIIDDKGNNIQTFTAMGGVTDHRIYDLYIKSGLKLDTPNRQGANVIHYLAQQANDIAEFEYFLKNGINLTSKDKDNNTVFHYASSQGNIELLNQLITKGLDPKALNNNNENALFFAAKGKRRFSNELAVFEYLIKLGLDPKLTNATGNNLLHYLASGNKNEDVFTYIIEKNVDLQKVNKEGNTPLMNAAERNNTVAIRALYDLTEDKFMVNEKGNSLVTFALKNKNTELAERALKEGADFKLKDKSGDNVITYLVATYDEKDKAFFTQYFSVFVNKGIEVQDKTIYLATAIENEFLVNTLLDAGVDINAKSNDGITALQLAAMKGDHTEFLKFLISKGADKNILTDFEESVYDLAKSNELLTGDLEFLK
ncbi:ankyrin repeat domain-containing protein [Brumimicrobium mesophilum]|uniref:ankyrin repeat domain-containing protein n=1 Tax=Brumimicrobium mesophilum TaxID=392717 RepID=UPI000D1405D9|nr:ankyrin repeat domain-containing protein [Brumimicrobium mesophilum]